MSANTNNNKTKRISKGLTKSKDGTRKIKTKVSKKPAPIESVSNELLKREIDELGTDKVISSTKNLYPSLNDPSFNIHIANKLEFAEHSKGSIIPTCSSSAFEVLPHQKFVRNFLSVHTPYNSLLLFHGLGSGKTCTAIGVSEEMRDYLINMNLPGKIYVIATPNVLENFELQLFNEEKLNIKDGYWDIQNCTGSKLIKEINPFMKKDMSKGNVVAMIKSLIKAHYVFTGYIQFSNMVTKCTTDTKNTNEENRSAAITSNFLKEFSNSLLIIDEAHNIRDNSARTGESEISILGENGGIKDVNDESHSGKLVYESLLKLITMVKSIRLLLLSATPLFHSPTEIIQLLNLMNLNDRRNKISTSDVFNSSGELKTDENGTEIGKNILTQKSTGYISYVSGENIHTFPRRIWPSSFSPDNALPSINGKRNYPTDDYKGDKIVPIKHLSVYINEPLNSYQCDSYEEIIQKSKTQTNMELSLLINQPIQCLNMIYPSDSESKYGDIGFKKSMTILSKKDNMSGSIDYIPSEYGKFFNEGEIEKYSQKINTICNIVTKSSGICLIYSQYIWGGIVPMTLALEARGFVRSDGTTLFKSGINIRVRDPKKYIIISGSAGLKPTDLKEQLNLLNSDGNKDGKIIKVVLITKTGAEGLDFRFIRQIHVMDPWFNLSRIEQIIGRGVRHCSHKLLPIESRNVEIYLHVSERSQKFKLIEPVDLYLYRKSELNAIQIGKVTRILKSTAVDCIINKGIDLSDDDDDTININTTTSSGVVLHNMDMKNGYSFSVICDFMENCQYECTPDANSSLNAIGTNTNTYYSDYVNVNVNKIVSLIKALFSDSIDGIFFLKRDDLNKKLPQVNKTIMNAALELLLTDEYEYIIDKYGRKGRLINISDLYIFQPDGIINNKISIADRSFPVDIKNDSIKIIMPEEINDINLESEYEKIISKIIKKYNIASGTTTSKNISTINGGTKQPKVKPSKDNDDDSGDDSGDGNHNDDDDDDNDDDDDDNDNDTWIKDCYESVKFVIDNYDVEESMVNETILDHIMEQISLTDMITLLNKMPTDENKDTHVQHMIRDYINTEKKKFRINEQTGVMGFLWWRYDTSSKKIALHKPKIKTNNSEISNRLCILISRDINNNVWNEASQIEIEESYEKLLSMRDDLQEIIPKAGEGGTSGSYIGFMTEWNNKRYIIFKIKNMNYNNKGTKCDNLSRVAAVSSLLIGCNKLKTTKLNDSVVKAELMKRGNKFNICIIHEVILRILDKKYSNASNEERRRYLLSPVEVLLSGI